MKWTLLWSVEKAYPFTQQSVDVLRDSYPPGKHISYSVVEKCDIYFTGKSLVTLIIEIYLATCFVSIRFMEVFFLASKKTYLAGTDKTFQFNDNALIWKITSYIFIFSCRRAEILRFDVYCQFFVFFFSRINTWKQRFGSFSGLSKWSSWEYDTSWSFFISLLKLYYEVIEQIQSSGVNCNVFK